MEFPDEVVISVTAEDISSGKPCLPCDCAVALAAQRAFPEFTVRVGIASLQIYDKEAYAAWRRHRYAVPTELALYQLGMEGTRTVLRNDSTWCVNAPAPQPVEFTVTRSYPEHV